MTETRQSQNCSTGTQNCKKNSKLAVLNPLDLRWSAAQQCSFIIHPFTFLQLYNYVSSFQEKSDSIAGSTLEFVLDIQVSCSYWITKNTLLHRHTLKIFQVWFHATAIKWDKWTFWFPRAYKNYVYINYSLLSTIASCLKKKCTFFHLKILYC